MCPSGTVPAYVTADNVTCTLIRGTPCRTDYDCNSRTTDCLGISMANPTLFEGSGIQAPFSSDLTTLLAPIVSFICSFNDGLIVDVTSVYTCNGGTAATLGSCIEVNGIPPLSSTSFEDTVLPQALQRDLWRSLLIPNYSGVAFNPAYINSFYSVNTLGNLVPT
ncbi:uncharacterized protein LOC106176928 [Lingula anatina]|uniref:Uncharacterized protein LOC106176928 n=1 Tax=Lingula anatina TaxID=7574 RepID=A0A1S3JXD5_LINAN|nr:uncharacterized protein LOC106176928 [Lingula anatina]XP_013414972.1 uncharacterized protein LOC106176928 [Lingula anatina]|eukprot:XP_013414971.1 uncharacterized protein LOC106176928 [Lingula anatina]